MLFLVCTSSTLKFSHHSISLQSNFLSKYIHKYSAIIISSIFEVMPLIIDNLVNHIVIILIHFIVMIKIIRIMMLGIDKHNLHFFRLNWVFVQEYRS